MRRDPSNGWRGKESNESRGGSGDGEREGEGKRQKAKAEIWFLSGHETQGRDVLLMLLV